VGQRIWQGAFMTKVATKLASASWPARAFYQFGRALSVGFCRLYLRLSVEGLEHVPRQGAFLLAPVHRSNIDILVVAAVTRRRMRYMGKDSLWKHEPAASILSALGGFPVSRDVADREALERCIEVLRGGEPLVLYPEGERKSGPLVQPLKDGAAYIAMRTDAPIVPVGIGGSERVMPKGKRMIYPRKVHVVVGPPILPPVSESGRITKAGRTQVSATLHDELQRLFDHAQARAGA
jgi:1-acyl-sn-glycerol-3-phosphate acyltransferase